MASFIDFKSDSEDNNFPGYFIENPKRSLEILSQTGFPIKRYFELDLSGLYSQGFIIKDSEGATPNNSLENLALPVSEKSELDIEESIDYLVKNPGAIKGAQKPISEYLLSNDPFEKPYHEEILKRIQEFYSAITGKELNRENLKDNYVGSYPIYQI